MRESRGIIATALSRPHVNEQSEKHYISVRILERSGNTRVVKAEMINRIDNVPTSTRESCRSSSLSE